MASNFHCTLLFSQIFAFSKNARIIFIRNAHVAVLSHGFSYGVNYPPSDDFKLYRTKTTLAQPNYFYFRSLIKRLRLMKCHKYSMR